MTERQLFASLFLALMLLVALAQVIHIVWPPNRNPLMIDAKAPRCDVFPQGPPIIDGPRMKYGYRPGQPYKDLGVS